MKKFRVAIIGCGAIGRMHSNCIKDIEGMDTVAYCDLFKDKAEELLAEYGGDYATAEYQQILDDRTIDAVYITTLSDTHAEYCIRALEAGKHVMVEKPLALTVEDCLDVARAVEKTGKKLMTAFKMRYYELLRKAKELIPNPSVVTMQMMDRRWNADYWASKTGGGNVMSQGVHSCDVLRYVTGGDPLEVFAYGDNYYQENGIVDNLTAVFRFNNRASASWVQGDCNRPSVTGKFYMQLFSEHKSVTLNERFTKLTYDELGKESMVFTGTETGFMEENIAFYQCLAEDTEPEIDHVDGLYATLMVLQAFRSIESGKPEPISSLVEQIVKKRGG